MRSSAAESNKNMHEVDNNKRLADYSTQRPRGRGVKQCNSV